jgi:hypothetical protein
MFKSVYIKDKVFQTKEELFVELKANNDFIIDAKKSQIYKSCEKDQSVSVKSIDLLKFSEENKALKLDENYYYLVVNSTNILDSHEDLHVNGIWNKSVKEIQGKNYLVEDHKLETSKVIVRKEHIEIFTAIVPFSILGKSYQGNTEVLVYKVPKNQVKNQIVKEWLDSGDSIEASVRMQYVTILLAMDSNAPDDATEKKNYDDYINLIANKDEFEYISHFYIVKEAKNVKESSLVVLGSNGVTGKLESKNEPSNDTQDENKQEPSNDTQSKAILLLI